MQFYQPLYMLHELDFGNIEFVLLLQTAAHARLGDIALVVVKRSKSIFEVLKSDRRMTFVLRKIYEIKKCAHRLHYALSDIFVARYNAKEHAFDVFRFLSGMLPETSEPISKMTKANAGLQNGNPSIEFFVTEPHFCPFNRVIHEKLVPLVERVRS